MNTETRPTTTDWQDFADWTEEPSWKPIATAPEDEQILVAATPDWVGQAYVIDDGDGRVWYWSGGMKFHHKIVPIKWMPMPRFPTLTEKQS